MAILNTGTYAPLILIVISVVMYIVELADRTVYQRDCRYHKEDRLN
jgi:hypothetical protein